jgi:TonB family protein
MSVSDPNKTPDFDDADLHLQRLLLAEDQQKPWFLSIFSNIKEYFYPPKLPPLELTSKPVAVKDIWGFSGGRGTSAGATSMLLHVAVIGGLVAIGMNPTVQNLVKEHITLVAPIVDDPLPLEAKVRDKKMGGGGGGGDRSPLPASKGKAPKAAPRQFVPPAAVVHNENPKLLVEPTLILQENAVLPNVNMNVWGDPLAKVGPPSNGTGSGGGIGSGSGGGVGSGTGAGFGPGSGGGMGGGAYRVGGGVSAPALLVKIEPEYSEEARKAKFGGSVQLTIIVDEKGNPVDVKVTRAIGLGLDEKAIEAVKKWRFRPGYKDGKAVATFATVEVNFRLL